jgi:adenosylhomocysteine nucleosidase
VLYAGEKMTAKIIGIMGAMPQEIEGVIALLQNPVSTTIGRRIYTSGTINGIATVVVFSRWGKVAAAATVSALIHHFNITELIFTGVAGAINHELQIGDIVIARRLIQHDMDARPLMAQFEIPLLGKTYFEIDDSRLTTAKNTITPLLQNNTLVNVVSPNILAQFNITNPQLHIGDVASGDQFFANSLQKDRLLAALPTTLCVEMEGAAVAQVCYEYNIPFTVIRVISDSADDNSHIDFPAFIKEVASKYSAAIIAELYRSL